MKPNAPAAKDSRPAPRAPDDVGVRAHPGVERLWREMREQPGVLARSLAAQRGPVAEAARALRMRAPRGVVLVARGSSDHAAVYARYLFEVRNRLLAPLAAPSTLTLYGRGPRLRGFGVIGVSQSGQGEDVVAYVEAARAQGAVTLAVVNDQRSPLARAAQLVLACGAGREKSIPATKTVTSQMALLAALSAALERGGGALEALPEAVEAALALRAQAAALVRPLVRARSLFVLGRGFAYAPALEVALKLKETSALQAEAFSAADFRHGPIALVARQKIALCLDVGGRSTRPCLDAALEVRRRGGRPLLLRAGPVSPAHGQKDALELPLSLPEHLAPVPAVVLGQLLALELGAARGLDPSRPRGLTKVTKTR